MSRGLSSTVKTQLASSSFVMAHLVKLEFETTFRFTDYSSDIVIVGSEDYVVTKTGHLKYAGTQYITSLDENYSIQEGMVVTSDTYGFASGTVVSNRELAGQTYVEISPASLSDAPAGSAIVDGVRVGDRVINFTIPGVSEIYSANGFLQNMGSINESSKLTIGSIDLVLSGVNQAMISDLLNYGHLNKKVTIQRAYINASTNALIESVSIFSGRVDGMQIRDTKDTSEIGLTVANHWADFARKSGRRTSSASQSQFFPDDLGFDFITISNIN